MFSVMVVTRFCNDGRIKNVLEKTHLLQMDLLLLVQVVGKASGCALC